MSEAISISPALEDYLEVILNLSEKNDTVRITDLAERLNIAKASVTQAVSTLASLKLLKHEKYGPIELTPMGKKEAEKIRTRHRILKKFLIEVLKVDSRIAEKDACLMEHVISQVTMGKLVEFLETELNEKNIIEKEMENVEVINAKALSELAPGARAKVIRVAAKDLIRRRIVDMGIVPGTEIFVEGIAPLGDPMEIRVRGYHLTLRKNEASSIFVEVMRDDI